VGTIGLGLGGAEAGGALGASVGAIVGAYLGDQVSSLVNGLQGSCPVQSSSAIPSNDNSVARPANDNDQTKESACSAYALKVFDDCMKLEGDTDLCLESMELAFEYCMGG